MKFKNGTQLHVTNFNHKEAVMKAIATISVFCLIASSLPVFAELEPELPMNYIGTPQLFVRGDVNTDDTVNIADAIELLDYLINGETTYITVFCRARGDVNDDESVDIADAVVILGYLAGSGQPPASPFPHKGYDIGYYQGELIGIACWRTDGELEPVN